MVNASSKSISRVDKVIIGAFRLFQQDNPGERLLHTVDSR